MGFWPSGRVGGWISYIKTQLCPSKVELELVLSLAKMRYSSMNVVSAGDKMSEFFVLSVFEMCTKKNNEIYCVVWSQFPH